MNTIGSGQAHIYSPQSVRAQAQVKPENIGQDATGKAPNAGADKVTLSDEGKALLSALKEIDKQNKVEDQKDKTVGDKVESFTYGALGMGHPEEAKEEADTSYSAGKYVSAALTVGGLLLALV